MDGEHERPIALCFRAHHLVFEVGEVVYEIAAILHLEPLVAHDIDPLAGVRRRRWRRGFRLFTRRLLLRLTLHDGRAHTGLAGGRMTV